MTIRARGVVQLVEALRYKPEGRMFNSRWGHCHFSLALSFRSYYCLGIDWELFSGGKGGRRIGLTTLPPSCVYSLKILGVSNSWSPKGLSRPVQGLLYMCAPNLKNLRGIKLFPFHNIVSVSHCLPSLAFPCFCLEGLFIGMLCVAGCKALTFWHRSFTFKFQHILYVKCE
jgi:hypothetical protein